MHTPTADDGDQPVTVGLDKDTYAPTDPVRLTLTTDLTDQERELAVVVRHRPGRRSVVVTTTDRDGATTRTKLRYTRTADDPEDLTIPEMPARTAASLLFGYGVCGHNAWDRAPIHGHDDAFMEWFEALGCLRLRDKFGVQANAGVIRVAHRVRELGGRVHFTVGERDKPDQATARAHIDAMVSAIGPGVVDAVALWNEVNNSPRPADWASRYVKWGADLLAAVHTHPAGWPAEEVVVFSGALQNFSRTLVQDYRDLVAAGIRDVVEGGDAHIYQNGKPPTADLDLRIGYMLDAYQRGRNRVTECGYNVSPPDHRDPSWGGSPVSEQAAATYGVRLPLEMARRGIEAMFRYQLLGEPNPQTNSQGGWGLVDCPADDPATWSGRPEFYAVRNYLALLDRYDHDPQPLRVAIDTGGEAVETLLAQRADGSHLLFLWRDVSVWDKAESADVTVPPISVGVQFSRPREVTAYVPNGALTSRMPPADRFDVTLAGELVALIVD